MTKVAASNVLPFLPHDMLPKAASRFDATYSHHDRAKHVMSFRQQLFMVLHDRGDETG